MEATAPPVERVPEDFAELMPSFMEYTRHDLAIMRSAFASGDYVTLARLGHSAVGAGSNYGMLGLGVIGGRLEEAAKKHDSAAMADLLDMLSLYLDSVRIEFVPAT